MGIWGRGRPPLSWERRMEQDLRERIGGGVRGVEEAEKHVIMEKSRDPSAMVCPSVERSLVVQVITDEIR